MKKASVFIAIIFLNLLILTACGGGGGGGSSATPEETTKEITSFKISNTDPASIGAMGPNTVAVTVPFGTDITSLETEISFSGASVSPASGVVQDFSSPVVYTVTAEDGSTKTYTVTVTVAPNFAKDITKFTVLDIDGTIDSNSISLTVPYGTDVTSLLPEISITGASVSPADGEAVNFSTPVIYTVTAADSTTKDYTVTVNIAPNPAKDITKFTILGIDGSIGSNTVALTVPYGTDVRSLTPTITITGASVSPASDVVQDFSSPVVYAVTAADGTTKNYSVTVTVAPNPAKDITKFTILGIDGSIGSNTVELTVPYGTDVRSLTPTITITGASVSPASDVVQDFSSPVVYAVTAADGTTKNYSVTVTVAPYPSKDITKFTMGGVNGEIVDSSATQGTIELTLPPRTDVTILAPTTITHTGTSVSPAVGVTSDFTNPVDYTVTAYDGSTKTYKVTVTVESETIKYTADGVYFYMNYVPGKTNFPTGIDDSGRATVASYWIADAEVTYRVWLRVYNWANLNGYTFANAGTGNVDYLQIPVTRIYWRDAIVWANAATEWYNAMNGTSFTPVYTYGGAVIRNSTDATACDNAVAGAANGFRLLTSNEWELAARWRGDSTNSVTGFSNPWYTKGDSASGATANHLDAASTAAVAVYATTLAAQVKSKAPNALGLYDMSGNVWEWCFDLSGSKRVARGGGYQSNSDALQVGYVYSVAPDYFDVDYKMGLRLAKSE